MKIQLSYGNLHHVIMFHMPCPSELQIRLMGQIYRRFAKELEHCPTDAQIHEHVKKFGPFIPIALYWSRDQMDEFEESKGNCMHLFDRENSKLCIGFCHPYFENR